LLIAVVTKPRLAGLMLKSNRTKLVIGILISAVFFYLAFRKVNFKQMALAFTAANYWYLLPAVAVMVFSHWLRAVRWRYLLKPIRDVEISPLFSSLIIGYLFNIFLPAHLGELVRAYLLGKKRPIPPSAVFGTIVIERIIDVFTLLVIMALTIVLFPFPSWVRTSGYLSFVFIILLFLILVVMKSHRDPSLRLVGKLTKPLPPNLAKKIGDLTNSFLDGIVPLKHWSHYLMVVMLSIFMWACYGFIFQLIFFAFDFVRLYSLPWLAVPVLLVITTISILVPSSPGYVGTYHYLCQLSLALFAVPASEALTYAVVMHGMNFVPVLVLGLILLSAEGMSIQEIQKRATGFFVPYRHRVLRL